MWAEAGVVQSRSSMLEFTKRILWVCRFKSRVESRVAISTLSSVFFCSTKVVYFHLVSSMRRFSIQAVIDMM